MEFLESDVWDVMEVSRKASEPEPTSIGLLSRQLQTSARLIPVAKKNPTHEPELAHHSAPVNIPNWPKAYYGKSLLKGKNSSRNSSFADHDCDWLDKEIRDGNELSRNNDEEEYEDGYDCRLPPHEWLARKQTKNQIASFSVCEGAGRTLKGRDLSKVRHAVLTKTGFI